MFVSFTLENISFSISLLNALINASDVTLKPICIAMIVKNSELIIFKLSSILRTDECDNILMIKVITANTPGTTNSKHILFLLNPSE